MATAERGVPKGPGDQETTQRRIRESEPTQALSGWVKAGERGRRRTKQQETASYCTTEEPCCEFCRKSFETSGVGLGRERSVQGLHYPVKLPITSSQRMLQSILYERDQSLGCLRLRYSAKSQPPSCQRTQALQTAFPPGQVQQVSQRVG